MGAQSFRPLGIGYQIHHRAPWRTRHLALASGISCTLYDAMNGMLCSQCYSVQRDSKHEAIFEKRTCRLGSLDLMALRTAKAMK